jgi:hypothetical protein
MNSYEENEMRKVGAKVHSLVPTLRSAQNRRKIICAIKACAVHKVQSFALRSV